MRYKSLTDFNFCSLRKKEMRRAATSTLSLGVGIIAILFGFFFAAWVVLSPEGFFGSTSPGTMVQLATSHVPTEEDIYYYRHVYPKMVRKEIIGLTGSDPGVLRPWVFPPMSYAGNTLMAW